MNTFFKKISTVPYIGTEFGIDTLIAMQNKHRQNVSIIKNTDISEIGMVKLQKMLDILHDEYECSDCSDKEGKIEKLQDEVYEFSLVLSRLVSMVEFHMIEDNTGNHAKEAVELIQELRKHKLANHKEFDMDF